MVARAHEESVGRENWPRSTSHFAFADRLPYEPGRGGALRGMARRVDGPLVASLFVHDLAVGRLYPLASLSSREDAAAIADPLYPLGRDGHCGAQAVHATEAELDTVGATYPFQPGGSSISTPT